MSTKTPSFAQMCEYISKSGFLIDQTTGNPATPEVIWNSSSTGEVYHIFEWYIMVCSKLGKDYFNEPFSIDTFNSEIEQSRNKFYEKPNQ